MKFRILQALRAIASLMVVADHLPRVEAKIFPSGLLAGFGAAGALGVDLFFVVSGFIMVVTTRDAFGSPTSAWTFLERRILRIYPAYWLAFGAFVLAGVAIPTIEHTGAITPWTLIASFLLVPHAPGPLMFVAWSLQFEIYFYLVFAFALCFARSHLRAIVAAWIALTLLGNAAMLFTSNTLLKLVGNPLTFEFIAGIGIGVLVLERRRLAPHAMLICGFAWLAIVAIYSSRFDGFATHSLEWFRVVAATPAAAAIVYGAAQLEERYGASVPAAFVRLGDASYTTYLWHGMILGAYTVAMSKLHLHGSLADAAFLAGGLATVIVASQLIYGAIEAPLLRRFRGAGAGAPHRRLEGARTGT
ncbi:MAG: acyltransferase [Candidatus Eremiobacteraeota bacterium]|nr:acyltransferase [Candidatus Eremiobacteraeota bacterium]